MTTSTPRSPLCWIGGKYYSAARILAAFPPPDTYSTYVEVYGGAGHVLFQKPPARHLEVYNDLNADLVNFWMHCRNDPETLQRQIDSLPYARSLHDAWQASLFDGTQLSDLERAVRWFYVLKSSVGGIIRKAKGNWGYEVQTRSTPSVQALHNATRLFEVVAARFRSVQIECKDALKVIATYERPSTLFYCDPPYIDAESYYEGVPLFTLEDHERLAQALNRTPALVALSYAPHEALDIWYPASMWRRITWHTYKHAERTTTARQPRTEILLMNYPEPPRGLWPTLEEVEERP